MPIRKRKPTSPGRRFQSASDFAEVTKKRAREVAHEVEAEDRRPQRARPDDVAPPGWRTQAALPPGRLQAQQGRRARQGRRDRVRPQPQRAHRAAALLRRREALHPRPERRAGRRRAAERAGFRDPARQRAAAALHPRRHDGAQRRVEAGRGRQDGPRRRRRDPADREGGPVRDPASAVHRDATRPDRLPRHGRARSATAKRD